MGVEAAAFERWFPIGIEWSPSGPLVNWFRMDEIGFDGSYFSDTVARCARKPFNLAFHRRTPIETLGEVAQASHAQAPDGFIFHLSRCGSTLVSRQFAACPSALMISEAPPVDAVVRAQSVSDEDRVTWLRWLIAVLGRFRSERGKYIVKLDAWHATGIALFERAFPQTPWVFVYRDPVEILASHMRTASYMMSCVNAPSLLGISVADAVKIPREEYCARVLGRIAETVRARVPSPESLVNYTELPAAAWERIAGHFGIQLTAAEMEAMQRTAAFDAKRPGTPFSGDSAAKQSAASAGLRAAAQTWVDPAIRALESLRQSSGTTGMHL